MIRIVRSAANGVLIGVFMIITTASAAAATLTVVADNTTPGAYNSSVGDLGAPSGNLPWFPAPNTFGGTEDEVFATAPDLSGGAAALGDWLSDPANLNANWSSPAAVPISWTVNTEVGIVYTFDAGPGLTDITADFDLIDNGIHIWVNGVWQFGARDPGGRAWTGVDLGSVGPGTNYIQILLEDSGGATIYRNPLITGTVVPVPAAAWLFGCALGVLGWVRARMS